MKSTWSILQGKNFQFEPLPPKTIPQQLHNDTIAALAVTENCQILAQHFADRYARAWFYDVQAQQDTLLDLVLSENTTMAVFILKGEVLLKTKPFHTTLLEAHNCTLAALRPGQHGLEISSGHCLLIFFELTAPFRELFEDNLLKIPLQAHPPRTIGPPCLHLLKGLDQTEYSGEAWQLKRQVLVLDLLFKTLDEFGIRFKQSEESIYHRNYDTLQKVKAYVLENAHKKLSVRSLATRFSMPPELLRRAYKKVFQHHLVDFIREVRLNRARSLLQNTRLPVHEIAWEVGYESSTSFARVFSNYFQQSPTDYRRAILRIA